MDYFNIAREAQYKKDYTKAFEWYQKAAAQGDIDAMSNMALYYCLGRGVIKDTTKAVLWWEKALSFGDSKAAFNLGICHRDGMGVIQNLYKAKQFFMKAKELGHPMADQGLRDLYRIHGI